MPTSARSPRRRTKDAYHHGDLRRALLDSAVKMISETDVASLSLRELARKAGVTTGAPYHHFADKRALLAAIAVDGFLRLGERMISAESKAGTSLRERIRTLAETYIRFGVEDVAYFRVMFGAELSGAKPDFPELEASSEAVFEHVIALVTEVVGDALTLKERRSLAATAWATCHGIATLWNEASLRYAPNLDLESLVHASGEHLATLFEALAQRHGKKR